MVRFLIDQSIPNGGADNDDDEPEPINLEELEEICKSHKYGATLLAVGAGLINRSLNIYLIGRERTKQHGTISIGYKLQGVWADNMSEWFTCHLHAGDLIEASVSTTVPLPYLAFLQQDVGDSEVTFFDDPVEETGGTLVRFHMPASDPAAPDLILRFYRAAPDLILRFMRPH